MTKKRDVVNEVVRETVDRALPGIVWSGVSALHRTWDARARPPARAEEVRFAGAQITVPARWDAEPPDWRGLAWLVDERAAVSLMSYGFEKEAPPLGEFVEARPVVGSDGYWRVAPAKPLAHPTRMPAIEIGEAVPTHRSLPTRFLRFLRHPERILLWKIDFDREIPVRIGAEWAAAFRSIRF